MRHAKRMGKLAIGLGIGVAGAAAPGIASADTFSPFDPNNFAISIDGIPLFQEGTAFATSGVGDFAIADGANSDAIAVGGFGNFASADGPNSLASAGNGIFDSASAFGPTAVAVAGNGGNFDSATAVGNDVQADAGLVLASGPPNFDVASVWSDLTAPTTNPTEALAEGSNDLAFILDPFGTLGSEAFAGDGGNFNIAGALVDNVNVESIINDFIVHIAPLF